MKKIQYVLLVILLAVQMPLQAADDAVSVVQPESVGLSTERLSRIDKMVQKYVDDKKIPGVVALVARHGRVAYLKAFGMSNVEKGTTMQPDSMFRIASMTKSITSVAVMMLYEEGHFLLNDPVSKFIPEFKDMKVAVTDPDSKAVTLVPAKKPITIRQLLNHTSGISYGGYQYKENGMTVGLGPVDGTIGEKVRKLASLPLVSQPGEEFHYGMSTDVLGYLVEVISGMSLDEFIGKRILQPLGMQDTHFILPPEKRPRMATRYVDGKDGHLAAEPVDLSYLCHQTYFSGGAGLVSTAADYYKFAQMLLNNGKSSAGRLLSRKTVELMTSNSIGNLTSAFPAESGDKFGYGFGIRTDRGTYDELESLGIYGWDGAFHTRYWVDPKEDLIAVFMVQSPGDTKINTRFRVLVYQAIAD